MTGNIVAFSKSRRLEPMDPEEFKATIKALGYTQGEFADYVGTTIRTVNDWGSAARKRGRAAQSDDEVRLGPPPHIVRLLRHMQRGHIDRAPVNQSVKAGMEALSLAVSSILGEAAVKEWDSEIAAEALMRLAEQRLELAKSNKAGSAHYAKTA